MPLVPAVTELVVAELLYLKYQDAHKPAYVYVNSTGCSRADGETVGYETEAMAIYDTMNYVGMPIYTVGTGVAIGQACMLLSAGNKGKRYMLPHATAMLHQPRVPSSGQRQAVEIALKWKEVRPSVAFDPPNSCATRLAPHRDSAPTRNRCLPPLVVGAGAKEGVSGDLEQDHGAERGEAGPRHAAPALHAATGRAGLRRHR